MAVTFTDWLARSPLVAILRGVKPDEVEAIGDALEQSGIAIVEVPLNSPDPLDSIARLVHRFGDRLLIGAGTVMTPDQVGQIAAAGAKLIVTPHADVTVTRAAKQHGLFAVPGFFTPTEAFALIAAGAGHLGVGHANDVLKAIRAVLPTGTSVLPVGGVDASNLAPWHAAGAAGYGIGSAIYKPGDTAATVADKAKRLVAAVPA